MNKIELQWLIDTAVDELQFANLQIAALYASLDEIASMTNDNLTRWVAEQAKERHQLDKLIHTRIMFGNDDNCFTK